MKKFLLILLVILITKTVAASDVTIEMLNKLDNRSMVFSQEIVRVDVGNTVALTFCVCVSVGNVSGSCLLVHPNRTRHRTVTNRKK